MLESGGRIVCGRVIGDYALIWTTDGLFLGTYVGAPGQTWKFERAGLALRLDQPRQLPGGVVAERRLDQPQQGFLAPVHPLGGQPTPLHCDVRLMFQDHVTAGQEDKIIGASVATWDELTWFWPDDRDGF